jgi:hypothetical protein
MTDYSNMPVLIWEGAISAKKASAQIHHAEPLIMQMPEDFTMTVDASAFGCRAGKKPGYHLDCDAKSILEALAKENNMPELVTLAKVAQEAGQVLDCQTDSRRLIFHD